MRTAILTCAVIFGVLPRAFATEIELTAFAVDGWTLAGGVTVATDTKQGLRLPAGARLSRGFAANSVAVKLKTSPLFGVQAEDWQVLEIGSVALAFVREGNAGKVVLLAGDGDLVSLPYTFPLDAEGYPLAPVVLEFGVQNNTVRVVREGEVFQIPGSVAPALEVIFSGGVHQSWTLDQVVVHIPDELAPGPRPEPNKSSAPTITTDRGSPFVSQTSAVLTALRNGGQEPDEAKAKAPSKAEAPLVAPPHALLGVFTPPSVRERLAERLAEGSSQIKR